MVKTARRARKTESAESLRLAVKARTEAEHTFSEMATEILEECRYRRSRNAASVFETGTSYLKTECYILIRRYMKWDKKNPIKKFSRYDNRDSRQPLYEKNQFYWGLLAIDPAFSQIPREHFQVYARQLLYAHLHNVPPEHLVGFLHQSGNPTELKGKIENGSRENEFLRVRKRTQSRR